MEDLSHEELVAAPPKLREEAARSDARVHAAAERLRQTAEVPTYVEVHGDHSVVDVRGAEKAMMLLSRLRVPLEHVQGAEIDLEIEHTLHRDPPEGRDPLPPDRGGSRPGRGRREDKPSGGRFVPLISN